MAWRNEVFLVNPALQAADPEARPPTAVASVKVEDMAKLGELLDLVPVIVLRRRGKSRCSVLLGISPLPY